MMNEKYQILDANGGVDYKAYSAARSVLRKRLVRLVAKQPDNARAANILQKLRQQMKVEDIRAMSESAQKRAAEKIMGWLGAGSLSLTGVREQTKKALATLESHGYTGLSADDLPKWGKAAKLAQYAASSQQVKYETALHIFYSKSENDLDTAMSELLDSQSKAEAVEIFNELITK